MAWEDATSPIVEIVPFNADQARICGDLVTQTKPLGLSLGDRACLALAIALDAPVYTAERMWKKLKPGNSHPHNPVTGPKVAITAPRSHPLSSVC